MAPKAPKNSLEFPAWLQNLQDMGVTLQRRLQNQMHSDSCTAEARQRDPAACCIAAKGGVEPSLTKAYADVVSAAKSLGGEIRQWDGHTASNLDKMSPARKANVCIQFLQSLPLSGRRDVYAVLGKMEQDRPDGLGLTTTDRFSDGPARAGSGE